MHYEQVSCLECGAEFDEADVNATWTAEHDSVILACQDCGALNELRSEPSAGPGSQPRAFVRRIVER